MQNISKTADNNKICSYYDFNKRAGGYPSFMNGYKY